MVLKSRQVRLEGSLTEVYFDNVLHRKECLHIQKKNAIEDIEIDTLSI